MPRLHTRFDSMDFPPYEFRPYPKMIYFERALPNGLPDPLGLTEGAMKKDLNGYDLAVVKNGKWQAVPFGVIADTAEHERELRANPPRLAEPERVDEVAELMKRAAELGLSVVKPKSEDSATREELIDLAERQGVKVDRRWSDEKIRSMLEKAE